MTSGPLFVAPVTKSTDSHLSKALAIGPAQPSPTAVTVPFGSTPAQAEATVATTLVGQGLPRTRTEPLFPLDALAALPRGPLKLVVVATAAPARP